MTPVAPTLPPPRLVPPPPPPSAAPPPRRATSVAGTALAALLVVAVGLAFADAAVVVLALPDLYREFDTSVVGVSWVLTSYAVVVTVAALAVVPLARRVRPATITGVGLVLFAASSLVAGLAGSFSVLLAARSVQGVGAALLLAGSIAVLGALRGADAPGRLWWAWAATIGTALGPALGGVLTELLDWRAIFLVQAPVAAVAVVAMFAPAVRRLAPAAPRLRDRSTSASPIVANFGFVLLFAALVGALFLSVLLIVEVWRFTPVAGAIVVSALPLGTLAAKPLGTRLGAAAAALFGGLLLATGLVGLGLLPGAAPWFAAAALAGCGVGFGLLGSVLGPVAIPDDAEPVRAGSLSTAARHAGIVLGLLLLAPLLASNLERTADQAALFGTATLLDARLPINQKVPLALALRDEIERTPQGEVPDVDGVFAEHGAGRDAAVATVRGDLVTGVEGLLTRSFRPAFFLAGGLALAAMLPALFVAGRLRGRRASILAVAMTTVLAAGAVAVVAAELGRGAWEHGQFVEADPCTASPDPYPVSGLDGLAQNAALGAINGAACELGVSREVLILSIDKNSGFSDVRWDNPTVERAVRAGLKRSIDDLDERGSIPGPVATVLKLAAERAPVRWLLDRLGIQVA